MWIKNKTLVTWKTLLHKDKSPQTTKHMTVRTYVRTYVCMYVCIYVCMYVYLCLFASLSLFASVSVSVSTPHSVSPSPSPSLSVCLSLYPFLSPVSFCLSVSVSVSNKHTLELSDLSFWSWSLQSKRWPKKLRPRRCLLLSLKNKSNHGLISTVPRRLRPRCEEIKRSSVAIGPPKGIELTQVDHLLWGVLRVTFLSPNFALGPSC